MFSKEMIITANQIKGLYDLLPMLSTIEKQLETNVRDLEMIADVTFLVRKSEDIFKAIGKRLNVLEKKAAEFGDATFAFTEEKKYSTENCTISSNSQPYVKFPSSPEHEGFEEFMKQLPEKAKRPHYPTVGELIATKLEAAEQVPFGLPAFGIVSIESKLRMTSKKEL